MSLMVTFMHIRFVNYREKTEEKQQVRPRHRFSGTRAKKNKKPKKHYGAKERGSLPEEILWIEMLHLHNCFFYAFVFCLCFLFFLSVLRIKSLLRANSAQTFPQLRKKTRAGVLI